MDGKSSRPRGRPPGAKNKLTEERERVMAENAERIRQVFGDNAFEGDAHAFLMAVYKNPEAEFAHRLDAAKAAIRYEKPSLASIEAKMDVEQRSTVRKIVREIVDPSNTDA